MGGIVTGSRATARAPGGEGSAAGGRADPDQRQYTHRGYDANGNQWAEQRSSGGRKGKGPSFGDMQDFSASENEGSGRRRRKAHQSPFERGSSSSNQYAGDQYDVNAPVQPNAGAAEHYDVPQLLPAGSSKEAEAQALKELDDALTKEKGMQADMCLTFNGSPLQFAQSSADVRAPAGTTRSKESGGQMRADAQPGARREGTFDPSVYHIPAADVHQNFRSAEQHATIKDQKMRDVATLTASRKSLLPLAVHVDNYHNPFSFPVGIRAKHEPLNTTIKGSSGKFLCVLPPGTGNMNKTIDLRPKINVGRICAASQIATEDPQAMWKESGPDAPDVVMVKENSRLHGAIHKLVVNGQVDPIDLGALPVRQLYGGRFLDGVPKAAAMYAVDKMQRVKESTHAKMPIDHMSFTVHPLNHEERWDGSHLTREGFLASNNRDAHEDYLNTPQCVTLGVRMDYL